MIAIAFPPYSLFCIDLCLPWPFLPFAIGAKTLTLHDGHQVVSVRPSLQGLGCGSCVHNLPPARTLSVSWGLLQNTRRPQPTQWENHRESFSKMAAFAPQGQANCMSVPVFFMSSPSRQPIHPSIYPPIYPAAEQDSYCCVASSAIRIRSATHIPGAGCTR